MSFSYGKTSSVIPIGGVATLTGNSGGAVGPSSGNINVVGSGDITVVGNPGTNTLTITASAAVADTYTTDSGSAVPALNVLQVRGGTAIATSGSGNTVSIAVSDVPVANGGTGNTTFTAYSVITAGTTATGAFQNVVGVGSVGQVLTSAGASALPVWSNGASILTVTNVTHATGAPYVVLSTDEFITADVTGGVITINLPNAPTTGRTITIKDKVGLSGTSNITVTTVGGAVTIDGSTSLTMNTAYESISVIFDGTSYFVY